MSKAGEYDVPITIGAFPDAESDKQISTQQSLWQAVHARRAEYTAPCQARIKVGTWNVAAIKGTERDLSKWFAKKTSVALARPSSTTKEALEHESHGVEDVKRPSSNENTERNEGEEDRFTGDHIATHQDEPGHDASEDIDLYVLGLQEIVDVSSPAEALRPYTDPGPSQKWKAALLDALPPKYELVAEQQLVGMLLLIAASPSFAPKVSSVSTTSVGTGVWGYMGNKGGVAARIVLGETTTAVFVNCHLAAGSDKASLDRRNWDAGQISQRTRFRPVEHESGLADGDREAIGDEDFAWWFGDLNYRLDGLSGDDVRRLLTLHVRDEYRLIENPEQDPEGGLQEMRQKTEASDEESVSRSSWDSKGSASGKSDSGGPPSSRVSISDEDLDSTSDPASLATTLSSLLPHDQLRMQQAAGKAFHDGWREGPISFLPTYKYDVGSIGMFDSSEKKRAPSWCDRILFRTRHHPVAVNAKNQDESKEESSDDDKSADGSSSKASKEETDLLFDYDPETDGADDEQTTVDGDKREEDDEAISHHGDGRLRLLAYTSHQQVSSSDHKPLIGLFELSYDEVVPALKRKVYEEVVRQLDRLENAERPGVTLVVEKGHETVQGGQGNADEPQPSADTNTVSFGEVGYMQDKYRSVTVANTSRVPTRICFMEGSGKNAVLPPWLSLHIDDSNSKSVPSEDTLNKDVLLLPGDTINASFHLCVEDVRLVRALNKAASKLEHVLVLRVLGGRDYFIPIQAGWMQSTFGRPLEDLVKLPEGGVRALQDRSDRNERPSTGERRSSVPAPIVSFAEAMDALASRVVAEWSMTTGDAADSSAPWDEHAGWPFAAASWTLTDKAERRALRLRVHEALDTVKPLSSLFEAGTPPLQQIEIVAEVLVDFLARLKGGIITKALWAKIDHELFHHHRHKNKSFSRPEDEQTWVFDIISSSSIHNVSFVFLTSMLSHVASEIVLGDSHQGDVYGPRSPSDTSSAPTSPSKTSAEGGSPGGKPSKARRHLITRAYADIFAGVLIRGQLPLREKDKRAEMERRRHIIEVFLDVA